MASRPSRTTRRGDACGNALGTPTAASRSVMDRGRIRTPVAIAVRPSDTDRNSGIVKNRPACTRYWKKNMTSPPVIWRYLKIEARTSGSRPDASTCASQTMSSQIVSVPARISQIVGETPSREGPPALGCTQPHSADRSTPKTARPSPAAVRTAPITSRGSRSDGGESLTLRARARMPSTITTSPTNTQRQEKYVVAKPPMSGPTATATAPAPMTSP